MTSLSIQYTDGPDRCHGSTKCAEYHDMSGTLPSPISAKYNCCCCEPCNYVIPNSQDPAPVGDIALYGCCRCVPRGFLAIFTPSDSEDPCCSEWAYPIFLGMGGDGIESKWPRWTGTFAGVTLVVTIEREYTIPGYPITPSVTDRCFWHFVVTDDGYPTYDAEVDIDHVNVTCLNVPESGVSFSATDWRGCPGTVTLKNYKRARLPYVSRSVYLLGANECDDDELVALSCIKFDGTQWSICGIENGYPCFESPDHARKMYFDGSSWVVITIADGSTYATGPSGTCLFAGQWSLVATPTVMFDVKRCQNRYVSRPVDLCLTDECVDGEVVGLNCVKVSIAKHTNGRIHDRRSERWWKEGVYGSYPYFVSPDDRFTMYYTGSTWTVRRNSDSTTYADGPNDECPFGDSWSRTEAPDDIFCVQRCNNLGLSPRAEGNFIELGEPAPCLTGEAAALTNIAVDGIVWDQTTTENGYPVFSDAGGFWKLHFNTTGVSRWEIQDVASGETISTFTEGETCPFGRWNNGWLVSRSTERYWHPGFCTQVCRIVSVIGTRRLTDSSERVEFRWFDDVCEETPDDPYGLYDLVPGNIRLDHVVWHRDSDDDINGQPSWVYNQSIGACTEGTASTFERCLVDSYARKWKQVDCDSDNELIDGFPCYRYAESTIRWSENFQMWRLYNGAGTLIATKAYDPYTASTACPQGTWTLVGGGTFNLYAWPELTVFWNTSNWVLGDVDGAVTIATGPANIDCVVGRYTGTLGSFHVVDANDCKRGWEYDIPNTDPQQTQYIYLEPTMCGGAMLVTDFESGAEYFPAWPIDEDNGCSCGLNEHPWVVVGLYGLGFTVRCGYEHWWEYFCGTCRCVPKEMCAVVTQGYSTTRMVLVWDEDTRCWGSDYDPIKICLGRDPDDDDHGCLLTLTAPGYVFEHESHIEPQSYPCSTELENPKGFDPTHDFMGFIFEDGANDFHVWVVGPSENCWYWPCGATPCRTACSGDPQQLTVTFRWWTLLEDMSPPPAYENVFDISFEVTVYRREWLYAFVDGQPIFRCGYFGYAALPVTGVFCGDPGWLEVRLWGATNNGQMEVYHWGADWPRNNIDFGLTEYGFDSVTCEPLLAYWESSVGSLFSSGFVACTGDWNGVYVAYHHSVTVTE